MPLKLRRGLTALFPQAGPSQLPRRVTAAISAAALAVVTLLELARQQGVPAIGSFWAEDGALLYHAALTKPFFTNLATPYDGYLEVVPRVAIEATQLFSVAAATEVAAVAGALILGLCALLVFHAARGILPSPVSRCVLVGAVLLLPVAGGELLDNVINSPWWLTFAVFWVLLWRPTTNWGRAIAGLFCFATAASTVVVVFYLPLALARGVALPRRRENAATLGLLAGLALQIPAVVLSTTGGSAYPRSTSHIVSLFLIRVATGSLTGVAVTNSLISSASTLAVVLGVAVLIVVVSLVIASRERRVHLFGAFALAACFALFAFELWYRGGGMWMNGRPAIYGGRYVAIPQLLLVSVVVVAADQLRPRISGRQLSLGAIIVAACLVPAWVRDFQTPNWRSSGPDWPAEVAKATLACAQPGVRSDTLAIAPAGWAVVVPCDKLHGT